MNTNGQRAEEIRLITDKINRGAGLSDDELSQLIIYADRLRRKAYENYRSFFDTYAPSLYREYGMVLPRFRWGRNDFYDYLRQNPDFLREHPQTLLSPDDFPGFLHEYLQFECAGVIDPTEIQTLLERLTASPCDDRSLPAPRQKDAVYKYEDGNSYKELGLKSHFEKIGRYDFVSRIQSYRYLRGNKSSTDKIEVLGPDCLGGIFTNKEKSIYYYIFLTESNYQRAVNACRLLNRELYDRY
ncbi:MAG TPA: hypothetical protein VN441_08765 [Syntrophomonas sp.]|nr:hypothetical protein [Syntrophomonas sp.]